MDICTQTQFFKEEELDGSEGTREKSVVAGSDLEDNISNDRNAIMHTVSNCLDVNQDRHSGSKLFAKVMSRRQVTASKERVDYDKFFNPIAGFQLLACIYKKSGNSVDPDQLTSQKPADLDLLILKQGRSSNLECPEKHNVRPGAPSEPNEYNFNYRRRGLFIIINNKNFSPTTGQVQREGTDVDAERLEETFQDTGFEVRRYDDVPGAKMTKLMYDGKSILGPGEARYRRVKVRKRAKIRNRYNQVPFKSAAAYDHSDCDCFGCAILSHGREGFVYATDRLIPLEALTVPFKGDRCPTLVGKPKLFFIQACRGTKLDHGIDVVDTASVKSDDDLECSSAPCRKVPVEADFLFSYSTVPGYYSWRNNQDGSWYIQALCIVLANYGNKMELVHMLTQVNRIVAYEFESCTDEEFTDKVKQMPSIVSMLTRYVHFRPKKPDIRG